MVGGVLNANMKWDIGKEVSKRINKHFPGAQTIIPKVQPFTSHSSSLSQD